jgi:hypothetical protein
MLVLCVGMYRACSTWQYGVAALLLERHRDGRRLGYADGDQFIAEIEPTLDTSWSVLKAHNVHNRYAELLVEGGSLAIYSYRDLRDVAFSWMHKTGATFAEIIEHYFLPICLHNDWFWRGRPRMLVQTYEFLIAEPARGVEQIAEHLGIDLEPGEAQAIAEELSLEANRKRTVEISQRLQAEGIPLDSRDLGHSDRETLLHWNHIREGRAGAWRDVATPEQKAIIARICGPWLIDRGYEPDNTWAEPLEWVPPGASLPRISHARNGEDILLDRLFRDQVGTYVEVGADHPTLHNPTYFFYLRGWRGTIVEANRSSLGLFAETRPEDIQLDRDHANGLAGSIGQGGLVAPDLFAIRAGSDAEPVLAGLPLADWRPRVFLVEAQTTRPTVPPPSVPAWEPILLDQGYRFAAFDGINRVYLRDDQAEALPLFEVPVNALDAFEKVETIELRERADSGLRLLDEERRRRDETVSRLAEDFAVLNARFARELEDRHRDYLGWLDEREGWRAERLAWETERQAMQIERQATQIERQATQVERVAWQAERADLVRRIEDVEGRHDILAQEVDALHGVIGRLLGDIQDRDVEIEKTQTRLRPYLKIDRLGVVSAIQKKVHAHRSHSKA